MKKFILGLLATVSLAVNAADFSYTSILPPGAAGMILTNMSTNVFGQSSLYYYVNAISFPSILGANDTLVCDTTNSITNSFPNASTIGGSGFTNYSQVGAAIRYYNSFFYSMYNTNALYILKQTLQTNSAGAVGTSPFFDVKNFSDANGQVSSNLTFTVTCQQDTTTSSNQIYMAFSSSADGTNFPTAGPNYLAVAWPLVNTNLFITNIIMPYNWMQGTKVTRLLSIGTATNNANSTGTNIYLQVIAGVGYRP